MSFRDRGLRSDIERRGDGVLGAVRTLLSREVEGGVRTGFRRGVRGAACALVLLVSACGEESDTPVVADALTRMDADNVVYGMEQVLTREGIREGVVQADTAFFYQDSSAVHLRGVELILYEETGAERARVEADRGRLEANAQDMVGRGNVVLTIPSAGRRIETAELHYSSSQNRIWSDSATVMEENGSLTCGTAFESDLEFRNVVVEGARTAGCGPAP